MDDMAVEWNESGPMADVLIPPVAIASVNARGTMTIPASIRDHVHAVANQRYLLKVGSGDVFLAMRVRSPNELFQTYETALAAKYPTPVASVTFPLMLDAEAVIMAQCNPDSRERAWLTLCDRGENTIPVDPLVIGDLLSLLPSYIPTLDRAGQAAYVQTILCWTGIQMPERDFYLGVLSLWAQSPSYRWSQAVQVARATR